MAEMRFPCHNCPKPRCNNFMDCVEWRAWAREQDEVTERVQEGGRGDG